MDTPEKVRFGYRRDASGTMVKDEKEQETIASIIEWHDRGVGPGGIANVLEVMELGKWTAKDVRAVLKRLDAEAGIIRDAEAVFTPGEDDDYGGEGWEGHGGAKFIRPWLDRTGRDLRDTGCAGEQGDGGGNVDTTFADRALEHLDRREEADQGNPFETTG